MVDDKRKSYSKPCLTRLGLLRKLTRLSGGGGGGGGGSTDLDISAIPPGNSNTSPSGN